MRVELPQDVRERIEAIGRDKTSGSLELSRRAAAEVLLELADSSPDALIAAGRALVAAQPTMAALFNLVNTVLLSEDVETSVRDYLERLEQSVERVSRHAATLLLDRMTVLTHSSSETVRKTLLRGRNIEVICTESRPMREGVAMAKSLAGAGIRVTLAADAAVLSLLRRTQLVLVGADAVSAEAVVNKTGTALIALAARELEVRAYALCGSEKFLPSGYPLPAEPPRDSAELLPDEIPNVTVWNRYFEATPVQWFRGIVSEDGILTPGEISKRLARGKVHPALKPAGV